MRVYIAGPYTRGDVMLNIREAILAADQVLAAGHVPFVPHLTGFWHVISPHPYQVWIDMDLVWLAECDAMIRLPGVSSGSDGEVRFAEEHGIPVYYGVEAFLQAYR